MRRTRFMPKIILFLIAILLLFLIYAIGSFIPKKEKNKSLIYDSINRIEESPEKTDITLLVPGSNSDQINTINECGQFMDSLVNKLKAKEYEDVYLLLNFDIIEMNYYNCDKEQFIHQLEQFSDLFSTDQWIFMIQGIQMLKFDNGVIASFCVAEPLAYSVEATYDFKSAKWQDYTFYFDQEGQVTSFLPFPEPLMDSYASSFGLIKKNSNFINQDNIVK